MLFEDSAFMAV